MTYRLDKQLLKDKLKEELESAIADLKSEIDSLHNGVDLDEGDTIDPEDFSHQAESGEVEMRLTQRMKSLEQELLKVDELPTEPMSRVKLGALIITSSQKLYISASSHPLTIEGESVIPISIDSPLYHQINDRAMGDPVMLGEKEETIVNIY